MAATISIPRSYMGQTLQESTVKRGLLQMQPELHFDMGSCLNIWHPYRETRQNVFYRGKSIGAMDRGTLPENPIWSVRKSIVEVPWSEVRYGEVALSVTQNVIGRCQKCKHTWEIPHRPFGIIACPSLCGNMADSTDATCWEWADRPTGTCYVRRSERDRIILVGWRHTFWRILGFGVPGITRSGLESEFRINLEEKPLEEPEIEADLEDRFLDQSLNVG